MHRKALATLGSAAISAACLFTSASAEQVGDIKNVFGIFKKLLIKSNGVNPMS